MKKVGLIIGACILAAAVCIVGAGLWLKGHVEEMVRNTTGMEMGFASIGVSYSPLPAIVFTDFVLQEGQRSVKVPGLTLYPDVGKLFSGQIVLKKVVFEEPLVMAAGLGAQKQEAQASAPTGSALSVQALPEGLMIVNDAKLVLQSAQGDVVPVSLTAQAEKIDQRLSVKFKNASVEEIGLQFVGEVTIASFSPLVMKVVATEGTFNPGAVKDFLSKFGYLTEDAARRIPAIERIDSKELMVEWDAASGGMRVAAKTMALDQVGLRDVDVTLSGDGAFSVNCSQGTVDAGSVYGWFQQNSDGNRWLRDMLARAKLKALTPHGSIRISALHLKRSGGKTVNGRDAAVMDGSALLSAEGLSLHLIAQNGQEQDFTINQLESDVTIDRGTPSVQVNRLTFHSSSGGTGSMTGRFPVPLDLKRITLNTSIEGFKVFDGILDLHVNKGAGPKASFDLALDAPSLKVSAEGHLHIPGRKQTDLEATLGYLRITGPALQAGKQQPKEEPAFRQPFDARAIVGKKVSAKAFVKTFQFGDLTRLQDMDVHFESGIGRAVLRASVRMCGVDLIVGAVAFAPSRLVTTVETKGVDVDLTSLVACFSDELPVYLAGRLYITGSFVADGDTPQALMDGLEGEVTVRMSRAAVQRISGLDPRLSFFLDILRTARISSDKEDSVAIDKGLINASLHKGRFVFDRFSLAGPMLSVWGAGEYTIKDKHLRLAGGVKTTLGVTKGLDIDRILEKGGT